MSRRVERLSLDTLSDLPEQARTCVRWELEPVEAARLTDPEEALAEKEAWLSSVLLDWGSCGRILYVDDAPAGFIVYAPPVYFPGTASFPTAPISDDAVQLATAAVFDGFTGGGLGRLLMQVMVKDLVHRGGIRAVECIGVTGSGPRALEPQCALPAEFLQRVGFKTTRAHARYPRMRLDLRTVLTWRAEVEDVLERLLGVVRTKRPVPSVSREAEPRPGITPGL